MPDPITPESIRTVRRALGLSQGAFARLLNERAPGLRTNQPTVARWETGAFRPSGVALHVITEIIRATPDGTPSRT